MARAELAKRFADETDGIASEKLINCWAQPYVDGFKGASWKITHVPGLGLTTTVSGACRGLWYDVTDALEMRLIGVFGTDFYTFDASYVGTDRGNVASATSRVRIASSATRIAILSNTTLYSWDGTTLTQVTDSDLPGVGDIAFFGNRFVALDSGTQAWYYSDLGSLTSWTSLGFFNSEVESDSGIAACVDNDDLILFNRSSAEVFGFTTDPDNPYQRRLGIVLQKGCVGRDAVVRADNSVFFVGDDQLVYRMTGYAPQRVSTRSIEKKIQAVSAGDKALIELATFVWNGQIVVQLSLPGQGTYWYNCATGEWNQRATAGATEALCRIYPENRQRGGTGNGGDRIIAGGRTGNLYTVSDATFADGPSAITRTFTANIPMDRGGVPIDTVALTGTPGRILTGDDPLMSLRTSVDGGQTQESAINRSMGLTASYREPIVWQGLGPAGPQGFHMEFSTAAACAFDITAVRINEDQPFL